ncbi:MAG: hypothetical protein QF561_07520 [Phycisphaerales bacterium]|jgi:hypothetical protein|nr:hypothetical protein [Phycisphaerales bacterium]
MNGQAVLHWVKSNLIIVICSVVILGSLIAGPIVSNGMNEELAKDVKKRLRKIDDLDNNTESSFTWPGDTESHQVMITEPLIDAYQQVAADRVKQSEHVVSIVQRGNRGENTNIMPELFPAPTNRDRDLEVLPPELHRRILAGYEAMLESLHAGTAPAEEDVKKELTAKRDDFLDHSFRKQPNERLTDEEQDKLSEYLSGQRLRVYRERASDIGVYLSMDTLGPPEYSPRDKPTLDQMFEWQWRLWVLERVAGAIKSINGGSAEPMAAIHTIDQIDVRGLLAVATPAAGERTFEGGSSGGGGGGFGGAGGGGFGGAGGGGFGGGGPMGGGGSPGSGGGGKGGTVSVPPAGTRDYTRSVTGRVTNAAFDVVLVDLDMLVTTNRIDDILEGLTVPVVMSVLDVEVARGDPYASLARGEYVGEEDVSRLVLTLETLWLRDWSGELMPNEARARIGLPPHPEPAEETEESL